MSTAERLNTLSETELAAVQEDLTGSLLAGWVEPDDEIATWELAELIDAAIEQHEGDDVDEELLGPRRERDERLVNDAFRRARALNENRSTCCGAPLRPVYVGQETTFYDCGNCGGRQT